MDNFFDKLNSVVFEEIESEFSVFIYVGSESSSFSILKCIFKIIIVLLRSVQYFEWSYSYPTLFWLLQMQL